MDLGIKGKRALVLSSSRGLGRGIAAALAQEGAEVVLTGRDEGALGETAGWIAANGGKVHVCPANLSAEDFATALADAAASAMGGVDILVNNTGGPPPGTAQAITAQSVAAQAQMMVGNVIALTGLLLPRMAERGWGRVLTCTSSGVEQPIPNLALSNMLRAALVGWNKTLASEVAGQGITCNILIPGRIHTDRVDQLDAAAAKRQGKTLDEVRAASRATIPMGRYGTVKEFAAVAAFLCSDRASYVTGAKYRCDGGLVRSL